MSDKFKGSIAQKNVQFPIETVITPLAGENYARAMIFVPLSQASAYLSGIDSVAADTLYEITSSSYGSLVSGQLLNWLQPFFKNALAVKVGIAVFDDAAEPTENTKTLAVVYEHYKMWAYFKFIIGTFGSEGTNDTLQVQLATLCKVDELYSDCWIGTNDDDVLTGSSALITALNNAEANARVIYNPSTTKNPALAQLGRTLASPNTETGTPVGNDVDMVAFATIGASGVDGENNLTSAQITALDNQKVGYQTFVGDGTDNVVTEGSLTLKGESVGANWVKHYIEYMCKVRGATLITSMNKYRNNATYQAILSILSDVVMKFVNLGRLDGFTITAPIFADLPASGDSFTVPNAWNATYIDTVREVTVYGTLYLTQPTR